MSETMSRDRRGFLRVLLTACGGVALSGCDWLGNTSWFSAVLGSATKLSSAAQHVLTSKTGLAKEYPAAAASAVFRANGSVTAKSPAYLALAANDFADYRLDVRGLVEKPLSLSLAQLRAMPARTQVTRHDCVEGWSDIGMWTGVPLGALLNEAGVKPEARYVVFYCADVLGEPEKPYYESIDLEDAFHPQTILAYDLGGKPLPRQNGAPLRARVERQLGYKMAKFIVAVELVSSFAHIGSGNGGYWEDEGFAWSAGI